MRKKTATLCMALCLSSVMALSVPAQVMASEDAQEPITLSIGISTTAVSNVSDGVHTEEYPLLQALYDATGVELDFVTYDTEKFGVLAAGGDLPDIVCLDDTSNTLGTVIHSGQLMRLNELLDEYGQNIQKRIPACLARFKEISEDGESVYYLSTGVKSLGTVPARNGFVGFKTRYDIYKAIGSPEITNEDDYLQVLKEMQDYQREQTGNDNIYALSAFADAGTWPYLIAYPFSHGNMNGTMSAYDINTGEFDYSYTKDSVFMDSVRFFNKAYRMGIFDPDGFTQKWSQYDAKVSNGEVLVNIAFAEPDSEVCGEDAVCVILPGTGMPYISGVYTTPYPYGGQAYNARAISSNCEYPERAMQVLDWLDSDEGSRIVANGVQGVEWDYVDGVPEYIGDIAQAYKEGISNKYKEERGLINFADVWISGPSLVLDDGYPVSIEYSSDFIAQFATPAEKAFAQDFDPSFTYPGQVYDKWVKEGIVKTDYTEEGMKRVGLMKGASDECYQTVGELDTYFSANVSKLIMAESDEDFEEEVDTMLAAMDAMGLQGAIEELRSFEEQAAESYERVYGE